jgi:hypothetical protein
LQLKWRLHRKFEILNDWFDNHYQQEWWLKYLCYMLSNSVKIISVLFLSLICIHLYACNKNDIESENDFNNITNTDTMKLKITVGTAVFTATLYNNETVTAFKARLPLTVDMTDLNGNEKYFRFPTNLPTNAANPGTINAGDLMLWGPNTLVLFYESFSTSYNYTKIGKIHSPVGLASALATGNVKVTFELE